MTVLQATEGMHGLEMRLFPFNCIVHSSIPRPPPSHFVWSHSQTTPSHFVWSHSQTTPSHSLHMVQFPDHSIPVSLCMIPFSDYMYTCTPNSKWKILVFLIASYLGMKRREEGQHGYEASNCVAAVCFEGGSALNIAEITKTWQNDKGLYICRCCSITYTLHNQEHTRMGDLSKSV